MTTINEYSSGPSCAASELLSARDNSTNPDGSSVTLKTPNEVRESSQAVIDQYEAAVKAHDEQQMEEVKAAASNPNPQLDARFTKALLRKLMHVKYDDIVNDFADVETFLILFDALFIELVSSTAFSPLGGVQTLSFIAAFENFLASLRKRNGRFKLVLLGEFDHLYETHCSTCGALVFLRNAVKLHMRTNEAYSDCTVSFQFALSKEFNDYVRTLRPSFIMTAQDPYSKEAAATLRLPEELQLSVAALLHGALIRLLRLNKSVVLLNALSIRDNEVLAFRCSFRSQLCNALKYIEIIERKLAIERMRICNNAKQEEMGAQGDLHVESESDFWCVALGEFKRVYEKASGYDGRLVRDFALYLAVKPQLTFDLRPQRLEPAAVSHFEQRCGDFVSRLLAIGSRMLLLLNESSPVRPVDLYDGRLLVAVFETVHRLTTAKHKQTDILDQAQFGEYARLCARLNVSTLPYKVGSTVPLQQSTQAAIKLARQQPPAPSPSNDVVELRHELIDGFLDEQTRHAFLSVDFSVDNVMQRYSDDSFKDKYHWHVARLLSDPPSFRHIPEKTGSESSRNQRANTNPEYLAMKKLRKEQQMYAWHQFYGVQLEGHVAENPPEFRANRAVPFIYEPLTEAHNTKSSTHSSDVVRDSAKAKAKVKGNSKGDKQGKKISKADEIRLANEARINALKSKAESEKLAFLKQVTKNKDTTAISMMKLDSVDCQLERLRDDLTQLKDSLGNMKRSALTQEVKQRKAIYFFEHLRTLTTNYEQGRCKLTAAQCAQLNAYWKMLHFDVHLTPPPNESVTSQDNVTPTEYEMELLDLQTTLIDYQLAFSGRTLEVHNEPTPDSRVAFTPDGWQVRLLDAVDAGRSVLVVAPTSTGKTFVSYYAMERALRASDDDIVVYVAPTKALVQQVAATVYARFRGKCMGDNSNRKVLGYFTRDYRHAVLDSQILVTVPQCLEILLLSAVEQQWVHRLRYIIFDELHCIGINGPETEGSGSWERIVTLAPCPFIALSATIGNPNTLLEWLQGIETGKQHIDEQLGRRRLGGTDAYRVELVTFSERYSELELYLYAPPSTPEAGSGSGSEHDADSAELIHLLHPFAAFSIDKLKILGIPKDLFLTARQVYDLSIALRDCADPVADADVEALTPTAFFTARGRTWLSRVDLRQFEVELKHKFLSWLRSTNYNEFRRAERVIELLGAKTQAQLEQKSRPFQQDVYAYRNIRRLVEYLHDRKQLPALVFADDRGLVERMALQLLNHFEEAEKEFLLRPDNVVRLRDYEKRLAKYEKEVERRRERDGRKLTKKIDSSRGKHQVELEVHDEEREEPLEAPAYPLDLSQYTLVPRGLHRDVFEKMLKRLRDKCGYDSTHEIVRCLHRGVGFHHAGMKTTARQAVEVLFRAGHLQVVFSTSTLALGIHMPCKSVVFSIDSTYLTPLQYRQMAGRAGRRGFDSAGNVVFLGVPTHKVSRLVSAGLGPITGRCRLSVSTVLRLFMFISNVEQRAPAVAQCLQLLRNPLFLRTSTTAEEDTALLRFFFAFSVHLLARLRLINRVAEPIGFAGMATHLHYHEPGNLTFIYLLQTDELHRIVTNERLSREERLEQLLTVLCYLFTHYPLPPKAQRQHLMRAGSSGVSKVALDPLPLGVAKRIKQYNRFVSTLLLQLLKRANLVRDSASPCLPFSQEKVALHRATATKDETGASTLTSALHSSAIHTVFQDRLLFLTGTCTDQEFDFCSPMSLVSTLAETTQFGMRLLPTLAYPLFDNRGERVDLNAYALDFFRHRSRRILERESLSNNEAFYLLYDFQLLLQAILVVLVQVASEHDPLRCALDEISNRFSSAFSSQYFNQYQQANL